MEDMELLTAQRLLEQKRAWLGIGKEQGPSDPIKRFDLELFASRPVKTPDQIKNDRMAEIRAIDNLDLRSCRFEDFCRDYNLNILDAVKEYGIGLHFDVNDRERKKRTALVKQKIDALAILPKFAAHTPIFPTDYPKKVCSTSLKGKDGKPLLVEESRHYSRDGNLEFTLIGANEKIGVPCRGMGRIVFNFLFEEYMSSPSRSEDGKHNRVIKLGKSKNEFLKKLGKSNNGKYAVEAIEQLDRIFNSSLHLNALNDDGSIKSELISGVAFGTLMARWKDNLAEKDELEDWVGIAVLSLDLCEYFKSGQLVRFNRGAYASLMSSPLAMDFYPYLTQRAYKLGKKGGEAHISWEALYQQFGGGISSLNNFRKKARKALVAVAKVWKETPLVVDTSPVKKKRNDKDEIILRSGEKDRGMKVLLPK